MPRGTYAFPKRYRLNRAADYRRVLRSATFRQNRGPLRILAVANTMPCARLGLIVGKRVLRRAHRRNTVKRVVREVFRTHRIRMPKVDLIVQLRGPVGRAELRVVLENALCAMMRTGEHAQHMNANGYIKGDSDETEHDR